MKLIALLCLLGINSIKITNVQEQKTIRHIDISKRSIDIPNNDSLLQFGGQISAEVELANYNNQQYVGEFYFGTPLQKMSVQFDTGSSAIYVITQKCTDCPSNLDKFNTQDSTSFQDTKERVTQAYGSGEVNGSIAKDNICFTTTGLDCIDNVSFIAVDSATDIGKDKFSALVGLAPNAGETGNEQLPSFA